jgi:hypothetical protein
MVDAGEESDRSLGTRGRGEARQPNKAFLSLLALLLVYFNIAAINAQFAVNFPSLPELPVIDLLVDPFFLFGMFNGYERDATELSIQGLRRDGFQPLAKAELLPGPASEHALWAQASRSVGQLLPARVILAERARFLERIRERHNRLHPDAPVTRVRVGLLRWKRSRLGRSALREPGKETFILLYEN